MSEVMKIARKLVKQGYLEHDEYARLLANRNDKVREYLRSTAQEIAIENYGHDIFLRGIIEFTNTCRNDCYYCGIRKSNGKVDRYRLNPDRILHCCEIGYRIGLRTFVLQGGEDPYFTDDRMCELIRGIKSKYPDCAITLSIGEKERESYERYFEAGADRFLLRHETADADHYSKLHPETLSLEHRMKCLNTLKDIGYQIGAGFMVGSPGQTYDTVASDFEYLHSLNPHMIGIGPFIHHDDTPFRDEPDGTVEMTLYCLSILRIMFPKVLLPATTALGTIDEKGREKGVLAGANVIMPSLSPDDIRGKYLLYDGKAGVDDEAEAGRKLLDVKLAKIGYRTVTERGDYKGWNRTQNSIRS